MTPLNDRLSPRSGNTGNRESISAFLALARPGVPVAHGMRGEINPLGSLGAFPRESRRPCGSRSVIRAICHKTGEL